MGDEMANYSTYMPKAYIFRLKGDDVRKNGNLFDLEKFVRDTLTRMGVAHRDPCCDSLDTFPVRLNAAKDSLEYFDPVDGWTEFAL